MDGGLGGGRWGEKEKGREGKLWLVYKMKKVLKKLKNYFEVAYSYTWVLLLQLSIQLSYLTVLDAAFVGYRLKYLWSF